MLKRRHTITICAVGLLLLSSCIKENRQPCPCWLDADFTDMALEAESVVLSVVGPSQNTTLTYSLTDTFLQTVEVTRETLMASAISGISKCVLSDGIVRCKEGTEYDALIGQSLVMDCNAETAYFAPKANRQYAEVTLRVEDTGLLGDGYSLEIEGEVDGIDTRTMTPVNGPFRHTLHPEQEGDLVRFLLPRQTHETKYHINVYNQGKKISEFPLYDYINRSGYDWKKESLDKIELIMERNDATITIIIRDWDTGEDYIVTL